MNRLVMNNGRVAKEQPEPLPPMPTQPQNHVWYYLQDRWYPIPRQQALGKGYAFQETEPDGKRCEDWQRRIDMING